MTRRIYTACAITAVVLPLVASQANASPVTKSFTGTVGGSFTTDTFGWFGTFGVNGGDITGAAVSGSYSYDPSLMSLTRNGGGDFYFSEDNNPAAIILNISINGHSYTVDSSVFGAVETSDNDPTSYQLFVHAANSDNDAWYTLIGAGQWVAGSNPATIDSPINFANTEQYFTISDGADHFTENLTFNLNLDDGPPTGTPEPASTGLLVAGLLGLTAVRRRRRR